MKFAAIISSLAIVVAAVAQGPAEFVDPRIGSEGLGRTYVGPTVPFGMIKPSVDAASMPNSGWAPMPAPIIGFAQTHVSGTGGGQKYGNILLMPFVSDIGERENSAGVRGVKIKEGENGAGVRGVKIEEGENGAGVRGGKIGEGRDSYLGESGLRIGKSGRISDVRESEEIELGRYGCELASGIVVELTSAHAAAIYQFDYPKGKEAGLAVDAGFFLGVSPVPDQRETQQLVGSQIEVLSDTEVQGYSRVRGGWNDGRAYTVYFYAVCDKPFTGFSTWKDDSISAKAWQADTGRPTGAYLDFGENAGVVKVKIAISYLSELKARENLVRDIPHWDFAKTRNELVGKWEEALSKIEVGESTPDRLKTMLYTGLYHTMLMPTDRTGENPLWNDPVPYYDDYYAIWDTYRTSMPMLTLIAPQRQADMVNSLINIYKRDGYMPDARSGNSNGRTQGGSNAEIAIADAFVKGMEGIDWNLALEAMLRDANDAPGGKQESEGRGGLADYNSLGYIPFGVPRAGNRTIEYSYCDYAIAEVADGLGRGDLKDRFMRQSGNWRNLWRADYEHAGTKGFIMPRDRDGNWLDSLPQGHSALIKPKYEYTPVTFEGPWYTPWWDMFFYEASSWEYSLSVPHDVPGLIEICGGPEAFERRLDTFFDKGFYNVNNEPSFLTPCLYHWIGKPWRSGERVREIVGENFNETPMGLPGNDDSGAMSSWLAFHLIGLYPNAGQDYYLINPPMIESTTFRLANGKDFTIEAKGLSDKNRYIAKATLNGKDYPHSYIRHADIMAGGRLELSMASKPGEWGKDSRPEGRVSVPKNIAKAEIADITLPDPNADFSRLRFVFKLHGQTRRYDTNFEWLGDTLAFNWGIERNLKWQSGRFRMLPQAVEGGNVLSMQMPVDGDDALLAANTTAFVLSKKGYEELKNTGATEINGATYRAVSAENGYIHAKDGSEGAQIWVLDNASMPIVCRMAGNPLEVDWSVELLDH
ncbi:MAG: GH92 family glycosyl hydrolase [Clostridium sp.]|nr:GH92 family glycosyl hydrolase [Clostridium sp.]